MIKKRKIYKAKKYQESEVMKMTDQKQPEQRRVADPRCRNCATLGEILLDSALLYQEIDGEVSSLDRAREEVAECLRVNRLDYRTRNPYQ